MLANAFSIARVLRGGTNLLRVNRIFTFLEPITMSSESTTFSSQRSKARRANRCESQSRHNPRVQPNLCWNYATQVCGSQRALSRTTAIHDEFTLLSRLDADRFLVQQPHWSASKKWNSEWTIEAKRHGMAKLYKCSSRSTLSMVCIFVIGRRLNYHAGDRIV